MRGCHTSHSLCLKTPVVGGLLHPLVRTQPEKPGEFWGSGSLYLGCPCLSLGRSLFHFEANMAVRVKSRKTAYQGDEAEKNQSKFCPRPQLQSSHPYLPRRALRRRKDMGREGRPPRGSLQLLAAPCTASCEGCFLSCGHVLAMLPGRVVLSVSHAGEEPPPHARWPSPTSWGLDHPGPPLIAKQRAPVSSCVNVGEQLCPLIQRLLGGVHPQGRPSRGCCPPPVPRRDPHGSSSLPQGTTNPHLLLWKRSSQEPT